MNRPATSALTRVLIVDDEADLRELISLSLLRMGVDSDSAGSVREAQSYLADQRYGLVLTDMKLPDGDGLQVVATAIAADNTPVAVITAFGSAENAVAALKAGAFDYVEKPIELPALKRLVSSVLKPLAKPKDTRPQTDLAIATSLLLGNSPVMEQVRQMIAKLARTMAPVAISGESGSGKELAARSIHAQGARAAGPFIAVNCGAIPEALMEAEFFGYRKGAFTGAMEDRGGFFQAAQGGTLMLDEVADLPLSMQVKLLRVIQERKVRKVGSTMEEPIDVRLISATHKDLAQMVAEGAFRQDLYYRLNVIELHLPSLAERPQDVPQLARHLLERICERHGQTKVTLAPAALDALSRMSFRGNVRELENTLERAVALAGSPLITQDDIAVAASSPAPAVNSGMLASAYRIDAVDGVAMPLPSAHAALASGSLNAASAATQPVKLPLDLMTHLDMVERSIIEQALAATRYNRTQAAALLGLSFRQFRYRMQRLEIK